MDITHADRLWCNHKVGGYVKPGQKVYVKTAKGLDGPYLLMAFDPDRGLRDCHIAPQPGAKGKVCRWEDCRDLTTQTPNKVMRDNKGQVLQPGDTVWVLVMSYGGMVEKIVVGPSFKDGEHSVICRYQDSTFEMNERADRIYKNKAIALQVLADLRLLPNKNRSCAALRANDDRKLVNA